MKQKAFGVIVVAVCFFLGPAFLRAEDRYQLVKKSGPFYYGHISYTEVKFDGEDPVVIREGKTKPEVAVLNLPLGPGDVIRTSAGRRCEIQFDTATIIRLDVDTELKIETILARSLSSKKEVSNLSLVRGRIYVLYKEYGSNEMFQIFTPLTAVKMKHKTVAMMKANGNNSTDLQVKYGKAHVLFGPDNRRFEQRTIGKGERLIVMDDHQSHVAAYISDSEFEIWNDEINKNFEVLHEGQNALPKPIRTLPKAVFYFAQQYGNRYGEWLWDNMYGYVWRPFLNQAYYPWGWQPYFYGQWADYQGQMFWIPEEPWGWIPYHLGIWQWDKKWGWVWLPGSLFAPAWVDWDFFFGNYCWRPLSLFDWATRHLHQDEEFRRGFIYADNDWLYAWPYFVPTIPGDSRSPLPGRIAASELKQNVPQTLPVPGELQGTIKKVSTAFANGDPRMVESMKNIPSHLLFVPERLLNSRKIQEEALRWENVPRLKGIPPVKEGIGAWTRPDDPAQEAARTFRRNEVVGEIIRLSPTEILSPEFDESPPGGAPPVRRVGPGGERSDVQASEPLSESSGKKTVRYVRDWNPDVKVARRLGASLTYSSRTNAIVCPELSRIVRSRMGGSAFNSRLSGSGSSAGSAAGDSQGSSVSSSSESGTSQSTSGESSRGNRSNTSTSGKTKIKKKKDQNRLL